MSNTGDTFQIGFEITGAGAAAGEAGKVASALKNVGQAAQNASAGSAGGGILGGLTQGMAGFASQAAGFLSAAKLIHMGLGEIAEDDGAALALQKYKLSVEEAAAANEMLDGLRAFGGDKVGSAEIFGKVMAGQTRILKQYGVELAENSTREERFAALQELHARGVTVMGAKIETLGGQMWALGEAVGDAAGKVLKFLNIQGAGAFLTNVFTDLGKSVDLANQEWGKNEKALTAAHMAQKEANRTATAAIPANKAAAQTIKEIGDQARKTANELAAMNAQVDAKHGIGAAKAAADLAEANAKVDAQVAAGRITDAEAARQKETNTAQSTVAGAASDVTAAQEKAKAIASAKTEVEQRAAQAWQVLQAAQDADAKAKALKDFDALQEQKRQIGWQDYQAAAEVEKAKQALRAANANAEATRSRQDRAEQLEKIAERGEREQQAYDRIQNRKTLDEKQDKTNAQEKEKREKEAAKRQEEDAKAAEGFTKEFGTGKRQSRAIADARKRAAENGTSLEDELEGNVKTAKGGGRKFSPRDIRSDADRRNDQGSELDRFFGGKKPSDSAADTARREAVGNAINAGRAAGGEPPAPAADGAMQQAATEAQKTAAAMAALGPMISTAFTAMQAAISQIQNTVTAIQRERMGNN